MSKSNKKSLNILKLVPLILMVLSFIILSSKFKNLKIEDLLNFTPSNLYLAAGIIILIFSVKSVAMFIPLTFIYIASSIIFPIFWAIVVNIVGMFICMSIPYFIGKYSGEEFVEKLVSKYPKIKRIDNIKSNNQYIFVFITKIVGFIPNEVSSLVLGSIGIDYRKYVLAAILAKTPAMLAKTLVGTNLNDPSSPEFILSISILGIIFVATALLAWRYKEAMES